MSNCTKCGEEISDQQFSNFKGLCPQCARVSSLSSEASSRNKALILQDKIKGNEYGMGWLGFCIFVCICFVISGAIMQGAFLMSIAGLIVGILFILGFCYVYNQNKNLKKELKEIIR